LKGLKKASAAAAPASAIAQSAPDEVSNAKPEEAKKIVGGSKKNTDTKPAGPTAKAVIPTP